MCILLVMQYSETKVKYRVERAFYYQLQTPLVIKENFNNEFYGVDTSRLLWAHPGCQWDGATKFVDFKWIMTPSLVHDVLHWLIALGIIPENQNDLIDHELALAIEGNGNRFMKRFRAKYVETFTNLVDEKKGDLSPKIIHIPPLAAELHHEQ